MQKHSKIRAGLHILAGRLLIAMLLIATVGEHALANNVVINSSGAITIATSKQSLASIMNIIEEQSSYRFFYNQSINLNVVKAVNITNKTIEETLDELFEGTGIAYELLEEQIILKEETNNRLQQAQLRSISGKVTDASGTAIPGATIIVKGTTNGTITDLDGNFSLSGVELGKTLMFSFVGMQTQEVQVVNDAKINISLKPNAIGLDEVVAIGYGTVKKRDLTGAVTSVSSEDITANPTPNPMESLQGQVAGLDITRISGQPGESVNIQLRGNRSFTASGNPTFYIDGMPGDYSTLNPNDIESIEVLKDASSTAIFGSSGANGVILITTKSAQKGKVRINLNSYTGFNGWSKLPQMRYGDDYLQGLREAHASTGNWSSEADDKNIFANAETYQAHLDGKYINWAEELMQTSVTQNYSLSISGGTENTKTYFSMNYSDEKGQYVGDRYKVYSSNFRIDNEVKSWVKVGANLQTSYVDRNKAYAKLENALTSEPLGEIYDADGNYNVLPNMGSTMVNLLLNNQENAYANQDKNIKLYINPYIEIVPMKGLTIRSRIGVYYNSSRNNYFQGEGSYLYYNDSGADSKGTNDKVFARVTQNQTYGYKWENILTYNLTLAENHNFTVTAVSSYDDHQSDNSWLKQTNIENNSYMWYNMQESATDFASNGTGYSMWKNLGVVGRVNYSYLGKYLLSVSMRADGASRLAKGNRWDYFPAVSAGWRISDESFMEGNENWLNNLKLRVGYGVTGTAGISPYSSANIMEYSFMGLGGTQEGIYQISKNYANPNLGWEKSYNTNLGIDFSALKNRVNMTLDWYDTKTDGVIWARDMPITDGGYAAESPYIMNLNLSETRNRGIELSLNTINIDQKDFKWSSTLTYTHNKEEITSLQGGKANNIQMNDYFLSLGNPVRSYYQYKLDGIWQLGEEADAEVFGAKPGEFKINIPGMYKETDGKFSKANDEGETIFYNAENKYTPSADDYQILGHNNPDWTLGIKNTFEYKGLDLNIFMYMRWGQMIEYDMLGRYDPTGVRNFPTYFNYWTPTNASNDFPAIDASRAMNSYIGNSGRNYVDGSYFKIRNITLGYTLPKILMDKWSVQNCRIYGTITNPLVIANSHLLKDYDPEMNGSINYPLTKQLVFGVNFTF